MKNRYSLLVIAFAVLISTVFICLNYWRAYCSSDITTDTRQFYVLEFKNETGQGNAILIYVADMMSYTPQKRIELRSARERRFVSTDQACMTYVYGINITGKFSSDERLILNEQNEVTLSVHALAAQDIMRIRQRFADHGATISGACMLR